MGDILLIDHANLSRLDLNLLVAFDALLAEGSVTRAAERVGVGQPSMSHALGRLRRLLKERPVYGCRVDGVRHDTGNKLGFLKAVVYFALRRPDLSQQFAEYLRTIDLREPVR